MSFEVNINTQLSFLKLNSQSVETTYNSITIKLYFVAKPVDCVAK